MAVRVFNVLYDGMGGLNWQGLEMWAAKLGVDDIDDLLTRLEIIKMHKRPEEATPDGNGTV